MQTDLAKQILASVVRKLLAVLFGAIVVPAVLHGWLSSADGQRISSSLDNWAILLAATVITFAWPIIWGAWQKVVARARLLVALRTPVVDGRPVATPEVVAERVDMMPRAEKLRLGTSPGNVPLPTNEKEK